MIGNASSAEKLSLSLLLSRFFLPARGIIRRAIAPAFIAGSAGRHKGRGFANEAHTQLALFCLDKLSGEAAIERFPFVKDALDIVGSDDLKAFSAHLLTQDWIFYQGVQIAGHFLAIARCEKETVLLVMHEFGQGIGVGGYDGQPAGHRLHRGKTL